MLGETIVNLIKEASRSQDSETTDLLFGLVTSINPLKIKIDNRFEVDEKFLILSALVRDTVVNIPALNMDIYREDKKHRHVIPEHQTSVASNHSHHIPSWHTEFALEKIRLWRGLKVGDKVRVLRVNQGQQFFVLEREEGIT